MKKVELSQKKKLVLKERAYRKAVRNRKRTRFHARLMVIHARIMMSLPEPSELWPFLINEWRRKMRDPFYIMQLPRYATLNITEERKDG